MTTQLYAFTDDYKADLHRHIDELYTQAKTLDTDRQTRLTESDALIEAYFAHCGYVPDSAPLERLATLILRDELTDTDRMKSRTNEYPILSDDQLERREDGEYKLSEIHYGKEHTVGFRRVVYEDENGVSHEKRKRIYDFPR